MLCDSPLCRDGIVVIKFTTSRKLPRHRVVLCCTRYDKLLAYGVENPNVLTGDLRDSLLIPFAPSLSNDWISNRKFGSYVRYKRLFPECRFIWFGDSGQGDVQV